MADTNSGPSRKNERIKWVLAGGLALALVYVVFAQIGGHSADAPAQAAQLASLARVRTPHPNPEPGTTDAPSSANWPTVAIEEMLNHNPFALLSEAQQQANAAGVDTAGAAADHASAAAIPDGQSDLDTSLSALIRDQVQVVIQSDHGAAAVVGTRVVKKGDVVEGWRVVEINGAGVFVEVADEP